MNLELKIWKYTLIFSFLEKSWNMTMHTWLNLALRTDIIEDHNRFSYNTFTFLQLGGIFNSKCKIFVVKFLGKRFQKRLNTEWVITIYILQCGKYLVY